ncbi:MAG TPA: ATP-binding protein [Candidatus Didemnitutus sp.]
MKRWAFIGGLTVTLLLLLVLSGFCIWATRGLTDQMGTLISQNYESIREVREIRSSLARVSIRYVTNRDAGGLPDSHETFRQERTIVEMKISQLLANASRSGDRERILRLGALCTDFFSGCDELRSLHTTEGRRAAELGTSLAALTGDIADLADQIVDLNEEAMLARRTYALSYGRRVTYIAVGFAVFSLGLYIYTSTRLTRAVFEPLRRLRDSLRQVGDRRFEAVVPIDGSDELGQIASSFNRMAVKLHQYVAETDERALQASRINRAILEVLPYPVYIVDDAFAVRMGNPQAEELSRRLGIPGALPGEVRRRIDEAAARGADVVESDVRRAIAVRPADESPAASDHHFLPQIFRMADAFDGVPGWAILLVDVSAQRRMDDAKNRALSTLGHEVKTPVAGLRMTIELLLGGRLGPLTPEQQELLEAGRDDCGRLLRVLRSLLELAQFEGGKIRFSLAAHPPAELLSEARSTFGGPARTSGYSFEMDVPEDLPAVMAEPVHSVRVIGNFLSNAAKYGEPGLPIVLRARQRGDGYVRLSVVNRARQQLSDAEQLRVFDPFFRRPGESAEGTGLGLAISREIAAVHGGRVGVFSPARDETTEFFFDLRIAS